MNRRLPGLAIGAVTVCLLAARLPAQESGYTFHRLVLWSEHGDPYPRIVRDPGSGELSVLFLGPVPEEGWDPVEARRLVMHGPAFLPADPIQVFRPRDSDPEWDSTATEASFDLNRDGIPEIVRARTVMIPDNRDPSGSRQRVLVELMEGELPLFGDLIEGPDGAPVQVRSTSTADLTLDGFPDMLVRLESTDQGGIAFYSQAPLRHGSTATRIIAGFSTTAFHSDRYGIFDLSRTPRQFFALLPHGARAVNPRCATDPSAIEPDGHGRCRYQFNSPYLGWILEFRVEFLPHRRIDAFDLLFPSGASALDVGQALDFLTPVLGSGYRKESRSE
jgi:hypothetical protein